MIPIRFGSEDRRLFGMYHPGHGGIAAPRALLFCGPFGQESIRVHRFARVLATRLAKTGVDTLRFDYFGSGDSDGADELTDLEGWCKDVHTAHRELQQRSWAREITWLGVGLGGAAAIRCARSADSALKRLVLWDPVLDGPDYLRALGRRHVEVLAQSFGVPPESVADCEAPLNEALGFAISGSMREQLLQMAPSSLAPPATVSLSVVADPADDCVSRWLRDRSRTGTDVAFIPVADRFDWMAEELQGAAMVPPATLAQLIANLTSG